VKMTSAINSAVDSACPGVSASVPQAQMPGAQATPLAASYQIGQTATVGDLRVSLDKVVSLPGSGGVLPTAGNRFVFVYITVENRGKNAFQTNMLSGTHWEDTGGKQYFMDPFSISLDPATTNLDGALDPGAKKSGAIGYQLPMAGGDMVWIFKDFGPNQAVFAVKASDIASAGTPVTEATEVALRAQVAATQTAFVQMAEGVVSADATHEVAGTDTPVPPEPTDTLVPEVPADTAGAQDTPPPDAPTDTPLVSP
nr:DUF4352 domain-containing protein [Chloroflexota bacterium]